MHGFRKIIKYRKNTFSKRQLLIWRRLPTASIVMFIRQNGVNPQTNWIVHVSRKELNYYLSAKKRLYHLYNVSKGRTEPFRARLPRSFDVERKFRRAGGRVPARGPLQRPLQSALLRIGGSDGFWWCVSSVCSLGVRLQGVPAWMGPHGSGAVWSSARSKRGFATPNYGFVTVSTYFLLQTDARALISFATTTSAYRSRPSATKFGTAPMERMKPIAVNDFFFLSFRSTFSLYFFFDQVFWIACDVFVKLYQRAKYIRK